MSPRTPDQQNAINVANGWAERFTLLSGQLIQASVEMIGLRDRLLLEWPDDPSQDPPGTTYSGLDLSTPHLVTPEWAVARIAEGNRLLVVNAWRGNASPIGVGHGLRTWREAGGLTAAYYVPHAFRTPGAHFSRARLAIGDEWDYLQWVAIDVENVSDDPPTTQWNQDHVIESRDLVQGAGTLAVIYTARYFWDSTGMSLPGIPLWNAHYGFGGEPLEPALGDPGYGGWPSCTGHQYQENVVLDGITVDRNLFKAVP